MGSDALLIYASFQASPERSELRLSHSVSQKLQAGEWLHFRALSWLDGLLYHGTAVEIGFCGSG